MVVWRLASPRRRTAIEWRACLAVSENESRRAPYPVGVLQVAPCNYHTIGTTVPGIYQALATRAGGEVISAGSY
jgi:hypothetical protein